MASKEGNEDHHVLMVAFSSQGHINQFLRLGKRLVSKGLHATLATTEIAQPELPGFSVLNIQDLPSFVLPSNPFGSFTKLFSQFFSNMKKHNWVLANSLLVLEKEAIDSMSELCSIRPVGPLVPPSLLGQDHENVVDVGIQLWKPEDSCLEWLNNQAYSSVIYVSFGSIVVLSENEMEVTATTLKNSKRPFL
ncbi:hypothetical protein EZV62_011209 [Acer yangbiense]|uniref:Uncharacterized protein n=1 Tax=Acer yangbiense TaxID=1000413 RepID=A0A5C7I503_9ROSI|nr:hypothetical protein EZV62_011209 [Acer yangbiense]